MTRTRAAVPRRAVTALVLLLAVALGLGAGASLALWRDAEAVDARIPLGAVVFGAGAPGEVTYTTSGDQHPDRAVFTFGAAEAAELYNDGKGGTVAIPVQVDSLAQGNRGLAYTVEPAVAGGLFGASTWTLTQVESPAACTASATAESSLTSTPWTAGYSDAVTPTSEYWCLVATWAPVSGEHTDTVTAAGSAVVPGLDAPVEVTGSDTWSATVGEDVDPADEPDHTLTFSFRTFRPGEEEA
ncbi:hypothetical protein [Cellulomonas shaoxiangyii]|uniref:Uncharacterized protein n=1 Tax=Cellulomonas shaoxiangyii TaxID=2566013 RepID=A0A4V1CMR4_9CELL|nr:hypothetical protein [Cellulomonas shaoxiangyii]QCB93855.1 hypothetical protein E5225_10090 [Cellulomonas shaoxiangyii]TGY84586.1 hypothetical protein E5226_10570 [Cellulomonas shaoxiangyii]